MKLFDLCKKKLGIDRKVFDQAINSGDLHEWSVEACLYASQKHDHMVIQEA